MYPFYPGIDLHLKRTYVVLMDSQGRVEDEKRLLNEEVAAYLEKEVRRTSTCVALVNNHV